METFIIFCILNVLNVIIQTVKSIVTIKCGKVSAALVNAIAFGLYTVVLVYMNCDLALWQKVIVVATANLIGVYVVKYIEEKSRKDALWKIEFSIKNGYEKAVLEELSINDLSYSKFEFDHYITFAVYAATQEQSNIVRNIIKKYNAKYFISETKNF